jgi:hypothetical protein
MRASFRLKPFLSAITCLVGLCLGGEASWAGSFLAQLHTQTPLASTVPDNGDVNPYAVVVAPVSSGLVRRGDVLVTNFNNSANLQGLGTTIILYDPARSQTRLFASVPRHLAKCPGGVGLTTAMTMLRAGYVIVGSLPSNDGTMATGGAGCLLVFDTKGRFVETLNSENIDGPWGNMAVVDRGTSATLFISNIAAGSHPSMQGGKVADVVRLVVDLSGSVPTVKKEAVIASGFQQTPDKDVFVIGPTGLALDGHGTLYVSDANDNAIKAIPHALTRTQSAGTGTELTRDGLLKRPLSMAFAPNGNLLVLNGQNGQVVEIDPRSRQQVAARWINTDKAQTPPGNGNLFGFGFTVDNSGFYFVNDDVNQLSLAH